MKAESHNKNKNNIIHIWIYNKCIVSSNFFYFCCILATINDILSWNLTDSLILLQDEQNTFYNQFKVPITAGSSFFQCKIFFTTSLEYFGYSQSDVFILYLEACIWQANLLLHYIQTSFWIYSSLDLQFLH